MQRPPSTTGARALLAQHPGLRTIAAAFAAALLALAALHIWRTIPSAPAVDFYHLWAIPQAHDAVGADPYTARNAYADHLNHVADGSPSPSLQRANAARRAILPTGTPSFYAVFALLPRDFDRALTLFAFAQFAAFIAAATLLLRAHGMPGFAAVALAAAAVFLFKPFRQDVFSGNVNSFQLLGVAVLVRWSMARERLPDMVFTCGFPALLAALAIFKPNIGWILALLGVHYAVVAGRRALGQALAAAAVAVLAYGALGELYFDGFSTWWNWMRYLRGEDGGGVLFTVAQGNHSPVEFLAELTPRIGLVKAEAAVTAVILGPIAWALVRRAGAWRDNLVAAFGDARFVAACGALLTIAASPLVWPHYQVLALLPLLWLASGKAGAPGVILATLAGTAFFTPVIETMYARHFATAHLMVLLAWVPLAAGMGVAAARVAAARRAVSGAAGGP